MKNTIIKILIFIFVPFTLIAFFYFSIRIYKKKRPGLYFKYDCKKDETIKFLKDNPKAQLAVCEGLYIPFGIKLKDKNYIKVLEKMEELYSKDNTLKADMKNLAQMSVDQTMSTKALIKKKKIKNKK